jgi:hypothetical protein
MTFATPLPPAPKNNLKLRNLPESYHKPSNWGSSEWWPIVKFLTIVEDRTLITPQYFWFLRCHNFRRRSSSGLLLFCRAGFRRPWPFLGTLRWRFVSFWRFRGLPLLLTPLAKSNMALDCSPLRSLSVLTVLPLGPWLCCAPLLISPL